MHGDRGHEGPREIMHPQTLLRAAATADGHGVWTPTGEPGQAAASIAFCSYAELARRSEAVAAGLRQAGLRSGDRVVQVPASGQQAVSMLFGAFQAGLVPVPVDPPLTRKAADGFGAAVGQVLRGSEARALVAPPGLSVPELPGVARLDVESLSAPSSEPPAADAEGAGVRSLADDAVMLCRLTEAEAPDLSIYTFADLADGLRRAAAALPMTVEDRFIGWLPQAEAAGLLALLLPMLARASQAIVPTGAFLRRPLAWLEAASALGATITAAPARGYSLCARAAAGRPLACDLSRLRCAAGVGRPIDAEARAGFVAAFAADGFAPEAFERAPAPLPAPSASPSRPLSIGQSALYFMAQRDPHGTAYNVPMCIDILSELDVTALERALLCLCERHPALRTVYPTRVGRPFRKVRPAELALERIDARELSDAALQRRLCECVETPLDLATGPLFRGLLFERGERGATLLLIAHHINVDGRSIIQLGQELALIYAALVETGALLPLPLPGLSYDDFVARQTTWLASAAGEADRRYWAAQLEGAATAALATDYARPARRSERGESLSFRLSEPASDAARALAEAQGATLFSVLLGVFGVALYRRLSVEDLVVATPVVGRHDAGFSEAVGYFVNTLPLRARVQPETSFAAHVDALRATVLAALDHQQLPYASIIEAARVPRDPARLPLCEVMFQLQTHRAEGAIGQAMRALPGSEAVAFGKLTLRQREVLRTTAQFDLMLDLTDFGGGVAGQLTYATDLFSAETAAGIAADVERLCQALCEQPEAPIAQALAAIASPPADPGPACEDSAPAVVDAMVTTGRASDAGANGDQRLVDPVATWNDTAVRYPDLRIHEAISRAAATWPEAVALCCEDESVSYAELERRTNRIARHLRELGVGRDVLVGVALERGLALPTVLLSILKAGGAYVPLDPTYPDARLRYMLESATPAVVIADREHLARVACEAAVLSTETVLAIGEDARVAEGPLDVSVAPDDLAYVIYTSGSTGQPKGAANTHAGLWNRLSWMQAAYGLDQSDTVLHKTPYSFDVSVWELFWPLLAGARMAIAKPGGHRDSRYLLELIERAQVTTLHFVPSMLHALLEEVAALGPKQAPQKPAVGHSLRRVICSGEALPYASVERFFDTFAGAELHNLYGPTEASIDVTAWACARNPERRVYIGRPIANTQIHILDDDGAPVAPGQEGELHIGGIGLARGYHGRPDLTRERFVPDPFAGVEGARLYRTGDLARWSEDGLLEYLGRNDDQIKLNGFRIELGEIEAVAAGADDVTQCVVVARRLASGAARLEAFVVGAEGHAPDCALLRKRLAAHLPSYMVPARIAVLDTLPLTHSGKADRRALLALPESPPTAASTPAPQPLAPQPLTPQPLAPQPLAEPVLAEPVLAEPVLAEPVLAEPVLADSPPGDMPPASPPAGSADADHDALAGELRGLWEQVLRQPVALDDNFFAVGGDSIRSLELRALARSRGLDFEVEELFEHQTVTALARVVRRSTEASSSGAASELRAPFSLLEPGERARLGPDIEDAFPVTQLQLGMLYHARLSEDAWAYHDCMSYAVELDAPLQAEALEASLTALVARHPALRSDFDLEHAGQALQRVQRSAPTPFTLEDVSDLAPEEREARVRAYIAGERTRRYQLDRAPLFRVRVHVLEPGAMRLTLSFHHAILDGWSAASLLRELMHGYLATTGVEGLPALPLPEHSPSEYAALERAAQGAADSRAHFAQVLEGYEVVRLPRWPERYRSAQTAVRLSRALDPQLVTRLDALAVELGLPLKSLLLAAHLRALSAHTGATDVVSGRVTHGRPELPGAERVLGLFLNTLPVRADVSGHSWRSLAQALHASERADHPHRRLPMQVIQRSFGADALFETAFNYVHFHLYRDLLATDAVRVVGYEVHENTDFTLLANFVRSPVDGSLSLQLEYDARSLAEPQARALCEAHLSALSAMADDPEALVMQCVFAAAADLRERAAQREVPPSAEPVPVFALFERQAALTPEAPAVSLGDLQLSYGELDALASGLSEQLRAAGAGRGEVVACCAEPSFERAVAVLAILKTGCAYLPIDPGLPEARLSAILREAGAVRALVTRAHRDAPCLASLSRLCVVVPEHLPKLAAGLSRAGLAAGEQGGAAALWSHPFVQSGLDELRASAPVQSVLSRAAARRKRQHDRRVHAAPPPTFGLRARVDDPAYVMYTSGSTGRPKGIRMHHRPLHNLVRFQVARSGFGPGQRTAQFSAFSFDVSFQEMFSTWAAGGELVMVPEEARADTRRLVSTLHAQRVARLFAPVVVLHQLADVVEELGFSLPELREINTAGEALTITDAVRRFFERHPNCRLDNQYGPTETHVATTERLLGPPAGWPERPSIGRPLPGVVAHVLDAALQPAPLGVPGELYLAGVCVASGYHRNPVGTAERFLRDPFADGHVAMYRTGDLVRYLPDGTLEYIGRRDGQVKIRGFRVELAEVEHAIARAAGQALAQVAVVAHAGRVSTAPLELCAYLVPRPGAELDVSALSAALARTVPSYMLPANYTCLSEMPLTRSGKLDRRALPKPAVSPGTARERVAPASALEAEVCELFEGVLGCSDVSVVESFFDLGGESLMAVRLMARIQSRFNLDLPIAALLSAPSVRELARLIEAPPAQTGGCLVPLTPISERSERPPVFCVHPVGGNVLCYVPLARHLGADQPCYALQARGLDGRDRPHSDLAEMARAYAAEIRAVQPEGRVHLAGWSFGGIVACEIARCLQAAGREVAEIIVIDTMATIERRYRPSQEEFFGLVAMELLGAHLDDPQIALKVFGHPGLSRAQRFERLIDAARERGLVPEGTGAGQLEHIVAVIESNMEMFYGHTPRRFDGRVLLLRCSEEMPTRLRKVHEIIGSSRADGKNGWGAFCDDVQVVPTSGNHLTVVFDPHAQDVARKVRASIDRALPVDQVRPATPAAPAVEPSLTATADQARPATAAADQARPATAAADQARPATAAADQARPATAAADQARPATAAADQTPTNDERVRSGRALHRQEANP